MGNSSINSQPTAISTMNTVTGITNACNLIIDFPINDIQNDGGNWYSPLVYCLQQVQSDANIWLKGLSNDITNTIPYSILNISTTVSTDLSSLISIIDTTINKLADLPSVPAPTDSIQTIMMNAGLTQNDFDSFVTTLKDLNTLLNSLTTQLVIISMKLNSLQNSFTQDQSNFNNLQLILSQEAQLKKQNITVLETSIGKLQTQIWGSTDITPEKINSELAQISANPLGAQNMIKYKGMMGIGPALHFDDPSKELAFSCYLNEKEKADNEMYSYASILLLPDTITSLQQQIDLISQSMNDVVICMDTVIEKTNVVNSSVSQAASQNDLILIQVSLQEAQTAWNNLISYVQNFQGAE